MSQTRDARRERVRRWTSIAGVLGLLLVLVVVGLVLTRGAGEVDAPPSSTADLGLVLGPDDAPRTVVVYEDFLCPFCGQLERALDGRLADLAEQGAVQVAYRPFDHLDEDWSLATANAFKVVLDAAGPEAALALHDALYDDQPAESGPFPSTDDLVDLAVAAGAAEADVRPGIEDLSERGWVEQVTASAREAGIDRTPVVVLDGEVLDEGDTVEELAEALLARLEEPAASGRAS